MTLAIAAMIALALKRVHFSPIAGYIVAGLAMGPVFHLVDPASDLVTLMSGIGIALICFQIGLTAKLGFLRNYGRDIAFIGFSEFLIAVVLVSIFGLSWGMPALPTLVLLFICDGSSTAIVFKFLERRGIVKEGSSILLFGVLTIEDLLIMTGISLLPSFSDFGNFKIQDAMFSISSVVFIVMAMLVIGLEVLPRVIRLFTREGDHEITLFFLLAVALGFGWLSQYVGVSAALGSFLAGLIVSTLKIPEEVTNNIKPLRDLFAVIFFVSIGLSFPPFGDVSNIIFAIGLAVMIMLIKFFSFTSATWFSGKRLREALRMGIIMIPISEFGLVIAKEAYSYSIIDQTLFSAATLAVLFSVFAASILAQNDAKMAERAISLMPAGIEKNIDRVLLMLRTLIFDRLYSTKDFRNLVVVVFKRTLAVVVIIVFGYAILRVVDEILPSGIALLLDLAVIAAIIVISSIAVVLAASDLRRLSPFLAGSNVEGKKRTAGKALKDGFFLVVVFAIAIILIVNATFFIRSFFIAYFEVAAANVIVFSIVFLSLVLATFIFYKQIKKVIEKLERIIDSL